MKMVLYIYLLFLCLFLYIWLQVIVIVTSRKHEKRLGSQNRLIQLKSESRTKKIAINLFIFHIKRHATGNLLYSEYARDLPFLRD
jgi:hypothetical protein